MPRSREPEIFTFERIPVQQVPQRSTPLRQRKRNTRVMYPANVRKYLPPTEKSKAKRWLVALCLVVFLQIYTEEACVETPISTADSPAEARGEEASFTQYQVLPFQSAEEQARQMMVQKACQDEQVGEKSSWSQLLNTTCPIWDTEMSRMYEQSSRNGYVVALLYPVYRRLGSEK